MWCGQGGGWARWQCSIVGASTAGTTTSAAAAAAIDLGLRIRSMGQSVGLFARVCVVVSVCVRATEFAQLRSIDCSEAHKTKRWQV